MPTYDYRCTKCNYLFEVFQKMTDENIKECPECGAAVKRLIGAGSSPIFKGSGFYHTDYKNNLGGKHKSKEGTTSTNTKGSEIKSTETKNTDVKNIEVKKESIKKEDK